MKITPGRLAGTFLIEPRVFEDARGFFYESFRGDLLAAAGLEAHFVQDNHSRSRQGTVRGLHFQTDPGQVKLLRCTLGTVWDVAVDIRPDSPTFGQWEGVELSAENRRQFYIPLGFAHGFAVLSDWAEVQYKCTNIYNPATEAGLAWDDPDVAVDWRVAQPLLSPRDQANPSLRALAPGRFR